MNHLDLFSGIGGFALAASWVWGKEHNIIAFVEKDKFCQKVLKKHWPDVVIHEDIKDLTYEKIMAYKERTTTINLLTGGFPCQSFSVAGKQRGKEDDRYLWPEMYRIIQECRPDWIIGENVTGIINLALDTVLSDLANEGYTTETFIVPACAVDAPHRRDRVWIVAYSNRKRLKKQQLCLSAWDEKENNEIARSSQDVADTRQPPGASWRTILHGSYPEDGKREAIGTERQGIDRAWERWLPEPRLGRVAHGISNWVDRLKSLGNAIVPQVVVPIMQAIKEIDNA